MTAIRRALPADLKFVRDSWRDSHRMSHTAGPIPMNRYREVYDDAIGQLLTRPDVVALVAHEQGEAPPYDLLGFICVEHNVQAPVRVREQQRVGDRFVGYRWVDRFEPLPQPLVHYVYVKQDFREHGLARALFKAAGVDPARPWVHTYSTAIVSKIRHAQNWAGVFDPRLARFPKNEPMEATE